MIYIGIDPGVETGFAAWDSWQQRFVDVATLKIHDALACVLDYKKVHDGEMMVIFEDARQRKWYGSDRLKVQQKLKGAGSIERDCKIWDDFLTDNKIPFRAVPPTKGMTKPTAEYFKIISKWSGRTSNHARDAGMLVVGK